MTAYTYKYEKTKMLWCVKHLKNAEQLKALNNHYFFACTFSNAGINESKMSYRLTLVKPFFRTQTLNLNIV